MSSSCKMGFHQFAPVGDHFKCKCGAVSNVQCLFGSKK